MSPIHGWKAVVQRYSGRPPTQLQAGKMAILSLPETEGLIFSAPQTVWWCRP
jgi:hypothetical protein